MVTGTSAPHGSSRLLGQIDDLLTLRVRGPEHDGRILRIRSPKCVIGSHPTCTLRLRAVGVRPFHCLILRGTEGMFIRRWSPDTCLNGSAFQEAELRPGDRLAIGPIELEVLAATPAPQQHPHIVPPTGEQLAEKTGEPNRSESIEPSLGAAEQTAPDAVQRVRELLESERRDHESTRKEWHQERQELQSELVARAADFDTQRQELTEQFHSIKKDLERSQSERQQLDQLVAERERQTTEAAEQEGLIQQLAELKEQGDNQSAERERLAHEATAARERAESLQKDLDTARRELEEQPDKAREQGSRLESHVQELNTLLANARAELELRQEQWNQRVTEWKETEEELYKQLQENSDQSEERETDGERVRELEAEIERLKLQLAEGGKNDDPVVRSESSQETIDSLRKELQQTRDEHQRARDEWHADRENLEHALVARGDALDQNEVDHKDAMEEAERLIHSLQQEGKKLLLQLEEARQTIREDTDKRKKLKTALAATTTPPNIDEVRQTQIRQTVQMPGRLTATASSTKDGDAEPSRPSARQTMNMTPRDLLSAIADSDSRNGTLESTESEPDLAVTELSAHHDEASASGGDGSTAEDESSLVDGEERRPARDAHLMDGLSSHFDHATEPALPQANAPVDATLALGPDFVPEQPEEAVQEEPVQQTQQLSAEELMIQAPAESEPTDEAVDDDGLIQSYMDRLLERVGRTAKKDDTPGKSAAPETDSSPPTPAAEAEPATPEPEAANAVELPARRTSAPEMAADLLAMRELANDSARRAIKSSDQRRDCAAAASGVLVAIICLISSSAVIALSPGLLSAQSLGGIVGLSFGILWLLHGIRGLISSQRLHRNS